MTTTTTTQTTSATIFANPTSAVVIAIDQPALVDMLMKNKGATAVTLVTRTETTLPCVYKVARVNGMIGFRYENSVNNQLDREGKEADFVAKPRKWGTHIEGTPLVEHKGNYYLELKVENSLDYRYESIAGIELDKDEINKQLPPKKSYPNQGTDKAIILRDYKVENILSMTYRGHCYLVAQ
jgi:hypothetical protein